MQAPSCERPRTAQRTLLRISENHSGSGTNWKVGSGSEKNHSGSTTLLRCPEGTTCEIVIVMYRKKPPLPPIKASSATDQTLPTVVSYILLQSYLWYCPARLQCRVSPPQGWKAPSLPNLKLFSWPKGYKHYWVDPYPNLAFIWWITEIHIYCIVTKFKLFHLLKYPSICLFLLRSSRKTSKFEEKPQEKLVSPVLWARPRPRIKIYNKNWQNLQVYRSFSS